MPGVSAPRGADTPVEPLSAAGVPAPARADLSLGRTGAMVGAAAVPVSVAAVEDADRGTRLGVEVLDQAISQAAGVNGFAFRVMSPSDPLRSSASDELPVEVGVDVSGLVGLYGGNFADRLQVVALPACALVSPRPAGCDASGAVMASSRSKDDPDLVVVDVTDLNDLVAVGLEGDVPVPADAAGATPGEPAPAAPSAGVPGSGRAAPDTTDTTTTTGPDATTEAAPEDTGRAPEETTSTTRAAPFGPARAGGEADAAAPAGSERSAVVLAVTAGAEGEAGTYKATPFSHSSEWEAGVGTGEFSWSYPIRVPAPAGGAAPSVAASYSSGSVDGMVTTANTQAGALGLGWADFANAFVERRYATCKDEGFGGAGDLCWRNDNATLSLNGRASELVPVDGTFRQWRLRDDPNWRVERFDSSDGALPYNDDDNDERWRVTTPDGTEYWFGLAPMWTPGSPDCESGGALETSAFVPADRCDPESVWTVPVWGDDPGDACYLAPPAINLPCRQAWRWNLDYVIDPNDNVTAYAYQEEQNRYLVAGGFLGADWYSRGGTLDQIAYGRRLTGTGRGTHTVDFWTDERCSTFPESGCPLLNPKPPTEGGNAHLFPDVPSDLVCGPAATCTAISPTFFSTHRYFGLSVGLPSFGTVDEYRFYHTFADDGFGNKKLWLTGIQRTGWSGAPTGMVMPQVNFLGSPKPNRIDIGGVPSKAMPHHRLELIVDEFGRWTVVTYGQQNPCPTNPWPTGNWDTNTADCYPQSWVPPGASAPVFTVFHKYLVTKVEVRDPISPATDDVVTDYLYEGPAAWHHADDEFVPNARQTWSAWRGYERTKVTTGNQVSRVQVFRGMNGDRLAGDPENGPGTRAATVTPVDGSSAPVADDNWLAGRVIYEEQLSGSTRLVKTLRTYTSQQTAVRPGEADPQDAARWVAPAATIESRADGSTFKQRRTTTSYNAQRLPSSVYEEGWLDDPNDNRCTRRSYSVNSPLFMLDYPQVSVIVSGNCLSSTEVRRTQTAYDGQAVGVVPTRGNPTSIQSRIDSATWNQPQTTTYDELGRPLVVTNPNGHTTTTTYIPATGVPSATEVRNHLQQVSRTDWNRVLGMPASETDPNGKVTSFEYDALGRTTKVFLPTEQGVTTPSHRFSYHIDPERDGPAIIHSEQLQSTSPERYLHSWTLYDANLREQQTQTLSPATGKSIVSQSIYDNAGRRTAQTSPQALPYTGFPGIGFLTPASGWANTTLTGYDALGRPTADVFFTGSQVRWTTERAYGANTVTVTPPSGARVRTTTDAYDRTAKVEEEESLNGGTWRATNYTYNAGDDLLTITDPAGNRITNTYDMLGRRTALDDPDAGDWTFGYDAAGNEIRTTDARGVQLHTTYDALNRPRQRHRDTPTGPLLAEWLYDAPGEAGLLNKTVRYDGTSQWTVDVTGYDARSRPTGKSWTVPAGIPGISGGSPVTFGPVTYGYDRADHMTSMGYPAVGGLPAETVTVGYNSTGQPETMTGAEQYVWAGNYDDRGRPSWFVGGPQTMPFSRISGYDGDQRLARVQAAGGSTVLLDHTLTYDNSGNITDRATVLNGQTWRECFGYDGRQRLTRAYTTSGTCASGTAGTGAQPYNHTYSYSVDGNLTRRVQGSTTIDYTYPVAGPTAVRPHAPTAVGGSTYTWDANGNQASRTVGGQLNTLTWDAERRLTLVDDPDGDTSMVYDADGARLLRRTPSGTSLYIEGHEITAPTSGAMSAVRTYTIGGTAFAIRTPSQVEYLGVDQQGSVELTVRSGQASAQTTRAYLPYGLPRGSQQFPTDRGWISQIEDDSTGLAYLNARYYDPGIGRFTSPDPQYDTAKPQTVSPYQYGLNNPVTNVDPEGLEPRPWHNPAFDSSTFTAADYAQAIGYDGYGTPEDVYKEKFGGIDADEIQGALADGADVVGGTIELCPQSCDVPDSITQGFGDALDLGGIVLKCTDNNGLSVTTECGAEVLMVGLEHVATKYIGGVTYFVIVEYEIPALLQALAALQEQTPDSRFHPTYETTSDREVNGGQDTYESNGRPATGTSGVDVYGDPCVGIPMNNTGVNPSGDASSRHPSLDYSHSYQTSGDCG